MSILRSKRYMVIFGVLVVLTVGFTTWAKASLGSPENNSRVIFVTGTYIGICESPGSLCQQGYPKPQEY